jgi:hypothetical protein
LDNTAGQQKNIGNKNMEEKNIDWEELVGK